jgi:hypothetical protein
MSDHVLAWVVVILPTIFAVLIEMIDKRVRERASWRYWVFAFGLALSSLTALQQSRERTASARDREEAIQETSEKVAPRVAAETSKAVTKVVTEQYSQILAGQIDQNHQIQNKLDILTAFVTHPPADLDSKQVASVVCAISGKCELPRNLLPVLSNEILGGIADNLKKRLRDGYMSYSNMDNSLFAQQHGPDQDRMREARKKLRAKVFSDNKGLFSYAQSVSDECAKRASLNLNSEAKELTAGIASFYTVPCCEAY